MLVTSFRRNKKVFLMVLKFGFYQFTPWAMPPALFPLVIFQMGSRIFVWTVLDYKLHIYASCVPGITGTHKYTQLLCWVRFLLTSPFPWPAWNLSYLNLHLLSSVCINTPSQKVFHIIIYNWHIMFVRYCIMFQRMYILYTLVDSHIGHLQAFINIFRNNFINSSSGW
jgi:hypothetical protein